MREFKVSCKGCGVSFVAGSPGALWCTPGCKKRVQRGGEPEPAGPASEPEPDSGLVDSVRTELEAAGVAGTFAGQLALALAKRLSHPDESGISSLSKELRTVMASALAGVTPPAAEEADEVAKAREARERKSRQASGRA